jgi:hypothetical protein
MKQPKAYRVYNGVMESQLVTNMEFKDQSLKFSVGSYAFEQALDGSWHKPIGHAATLSGFESHPFRVFDCEADAWGFELEQLRFERANLLNRLDQIDALRNKAAENQAKASQNETKPPE